MRVFIGGVMQGSNLGLKMNDQSYRQTIAQMIKARYPNVKIIDPAAMFPDSIHFDDELARQVLFDIAQKAAQADIVIAYLPEASMGTALEIVRAYDAGTPVISISPMAESWFIRFLSRQVLPTLESFSDWLDKGGLSSIINSKSAGKERGK